MITQVIAKNGGNLLKTGIIVILSTLASQAARNSSKDTLNNIKMDCRKMKNNMHDHYLNA